MRKVSTTYYSQLDYSLRRSRTFLPSAFQWSEVRSTEADYDNDNDNDNDTDFDPDSDFDFMLAF